jgi:hypothetical protein
VEGVERFEFPISQFSSKWIREQWGVRAYSVGFKTKDGKAAGRHRFAFTEEQPAQPSVQSVQPVAVLPTGIDQQLAWLEKVKTIANTEAANQLAGQREFIAGQNQLFREMVAAITGQARIVSERPAVPPEVVQAFQQIGTALDEMRKEQAAIRAELAEIGPGDEEDEDEDEPEPDGEAVIAVAKHLGVPSAVVKPYAAQIEQVGKEGFLKLFSWIQGQPGPAPSSPPQGQPS